MATVGLISVIPACGDDPADELTESTAVTDSSAITGSTGSSGGSTSTSGVDSGTATLETTATSSSTGDSMNFSWSTPVAVSNPLELGAAAGARLAVGADGSAIAVWKQFGPDGTQRSIWSARYFSDTRSWGQAMPVEAAPGEADRPEVVIDGNNNATVVWEHDDGVRVRLWASRLVSSATAWSAPVPVENFEAGSSSVQENSLAVSASGHVSITWLHNPGGIARDTWSNRYDPTINTWGTPLRVEAGEGSTFSGSLAVDPAGRSIAIWSQRHPADAEILRTSELILAGTAWSTPSTIFDPANVQTPLSSAHRTGYSTHDFDASGNGIALWTHYWSVNEQRHEALWWSRLNAGTSTWAPPSQVLPPVGRDGFPELAVAANGSAVATWLQQLPGDESYLMSSTLAAGATQWTTATLVGPKSLGTAHRHQVVLDGAGDATVAWSVSDGVINHLWAARLPAGSTVWSLPVQLESVNDGDAFIGALATAPDNTVIAAWRQDSGDRKSIMSARFELGQ